MGRDPSSTDEHENRDPSEPFELQGVDPDYRGVIEFDIQKLDARQLPDDLQPPPAPPKRDPQAAG